jgi:hypothetical protein
MGFRNLSAGKFYEKLLRHFSFIFKSDSFNDWIYRAVNAT